MHQCCKKQKSSELRLSVLWTLRNLRSLITSIVSKRRMRMCRNKPRESEHSTAAFAAGKWGLWMRSSLQAQRHMVSVPPSIDKHQYIGSSVFLTALCYYSLFRLMSTIFIILTKQPNWDVGNIIGVSTLRKGGGAKHPWPSTNSNGGKQLVSEVRTIFLVF